MHLVKSLQYLALAGVLMVSSCVKDDEDGPGVDSRDKFVGPWTCKEKLTTNGKIEESSFPITISKSDSSDNGIIIKNFGNIGQFTSTLAEVSGNSISIKYQPVINFTVSGSGSYSNEKISFTYTLDGDNATASCEKQ